MLYFFVGASDYTLRCNQEYLYKDYRSQTLREKELH